MKTNFFLITIFSLNFYNAQNICNYIENNPNSSGFGCDEKSLVFTNSINTTVKGYIYAEEEILIIPNSNLSITILPMDTCTNCAEPPDGSTVGTKKKGSDGANKIINSIQNNKSQEVVVEKNPVDNLLKLSLSQGIIKEVIIFDKTGRQVKHKYNIYKTAEIDVSSLPKGVYGVKTITNNNQTFTKQFIKN